MGADYYSYAFIGQKLDKDKLTTEVPVRSCSHNNAKSANFCSTCGKRVLTKEQRPVVDVDGLGLTIIFSTDEHDIFVALPTHVVKSRSSRMDGDAGHIPVNGDEIVTAKFQLKKLLEPYELWDEKSFGIWTVLYCSY